MNIVNNLKIIYKAVNDLKNDVKIIAVSKTFSLDYIKPLIDFGHLDFGENKVQEAKEKWSQILKINNKKGPLAGALFCCVEQSAQRLPMGL